MDADLVNARNLAQLLWSVAKLGNPETWDGEVLTHPEKGLREIGPLRFGGGTREKEGSALPAEPPSQVRLCVCVCVQGLRRGVASTTRWLMSAVPGFCIVVVFGEERRGANWGCRCRRLYRFPCGPG